MQKLFKMGRRQFILTIASLLALFGNYVISLLTGVVNNLPYFSDC